MSRRIGRQVPGLGSGVGNAGPDPPEFVRLVVSSERAPNLGVARVLGVGGPGEQVEREVLRERRGGRGWRRVPGACAVAEAPRHGGVGIRAFSFLLAKKKAELSYSPDPSRIESNGMARRRKERRRGEENLSCRPGGVGGGADVVF
jgi:hypothetical protein